MCIESNLIGKKKNTREMSFFLIIDSFELNIEIFFLSDCLLQVIGIVPKQVMPNSSPPPPPFHMKDDRHFIPHLR